MGALSSILSLLGMAAPAHAQDLDGARAFVARLYDRYEQGSPEYLGRDGPSAFTPRLIGLIRRDQVRAGPGYAGALDWDPICGCQDPGGLRLVGLNVEMSGPSAARATVRLQYLGGKPVVIGLDLAVTRGRWRVADIHEAEAPSVVALLSQDGG
jgi:hypothetical protein